MGLYGDLTRLDEKAQSHSPAPVPRRTTSESKPSTKPNDRTVQPNGVTERLNRSPEAPSLLAELTNGEPAATRTTERYSFEIYTDQKARIYEVQHAYLKRTNHRLSSSRIIRDALEAYLDKLDEVRRKRA